MRHETRIRIVSLAAGFGFAGVLQVGALLAGEAGFVALVRVVDWPSTLLAAVTPSSAVAFFVGLPLGGLVYSLLAYLIFRRTLAAD